MITNIINNLIHGLWFYSLTLEPKHSRKSTGMLSAGAAMVSQLVMIVLFLWMRRADGFFGQVVSVKWLFFCGYCLTALIFGITFVFWMSDSEPIKSLFLMSAYYSLWTFFYLVISVVTQTFAGGGNLAVWGLRIGLNLSALIIYYVAFKKKMMRMYKEIQIDYKMVSAVSVFTFIVMTIMIIYNQKTKQQSPLYVAMLLSTGSMMVIIHIQLFRFIAQAGYVNQLKQMQLHEKYLQAQISAYERMEQSARQTRHDFRHHNMVVAEYAREKDYQAILDYLQEYEKQEEEKYGIAFCKNHVVNNVLNAYVSKARMEQIEVKSDIRLGETVEISDYDLVAILANVLENAVNACEQEAGAKWIEISLRQKGNKLIFVCKNTCTAEVKFKDGVPSNRERIGVGINSVRYAAEKYDGNVNFVVANGIFTCQVILNHAGDGLKGEDRVSC